MRNSLLSALNARFNNETARIEEIIFLAGALSDLDSLPQAFRDFIEDSDDEQIDQPFGEVPADIKAVLGDRDGSEIFADWLLSRGTLGFLVKFATPVASLFDGDSFTYSWGFYKTRWVYGDTIDAAIEAGFAWVTETRAADRAKDEAERKGRGDRT